MKKVVSVIAIVLSVVVIFLLGCKVGIIHTVMNSEVWEDDGMILISINGNTYSHFNE